MRPGPERYAFAPVAGFFRAGRYKLVPRIRERKAFPDAAPVQKRAASRISQGVRGAVASIPSTRGYFETSCEIRDLEKPRFTQEPGQ